MSRVERIFQGELWVILTSARRASVSRGGGRCYPLAEVSQPAAVC